MSDESERTTQPGDNSTADSECNDRRSTSGNYQTWKRLYCWYEAHDWVDDPFMGSGQECARCGAFDRPTGGDFSPFGFVLGVLVGMGFGTAVAMMVVLS